MEEDFGQDKTEAPTQRRREEAREQGRVAVSQDLTGGLILLAAVVLLYVGGTGLGNGLVKMVRHDLGNAGGYDLDPFTVRALFGYEFGRAGALFGLFFGLVFVTGLAVSLAQVGFRVTPNLLAIQWERLAPARGWQRIFSMAGAVRALVSILKVIVIVALAYWVVNGRMAQIAFLGGDSLASTAARAWDLVMRLALAIVSGLVLIGIMDYGFQWWRLERSLRMTRQELKEEIKRDDGNPQVKNRVRQLQREAAQRRMMHDVPKATVVITNPTHLAVALRYDRGVMASPRVVAKGAGFVADRIIEQARRHAVPIIERKPLAQALYQTVKVGKEIPVELFLVVAEVLAYVYRFRGMV